MTTIADVQDALLCQFGLWPGDGWLESLPRAIREVGRAARVPEHEMLGRVLRDGVLLKEIAGKLTIQESFFFRHPEQLDAVCDEIAKRVTADETLNVQIWSAGCSQGEEPFSVAILLRERLTMADFKRVSIFATDINSEAISTAKEGIYSTWSFRGTSPLRKQANFQMLDERRYRLLPEIRQMVSFQHGALQEQLQSMLPMSVDVILFRNVAIYLSDTAVEALYQQFCRVLKPGGLLCLSCSDPPASCKDLEKLHDPFVAAYRKRAEGLSKDPCLFDMLISPASEQPITIPDTITAASAASALSPRPEHRQKNRSEGMRTELDCRRAMFEEPSNPMARFWYAITLYESDAQNRSLAQMNALADDLEKMDGNCLLNDGETRAEELLTTVRTFLEKVPMER